MLAARASRGITTPTIVIIPTVRDRLLPALHAGQAEIAIGGFTVDEARSQAVAFSRPTLHGRPPCRGRRPGRTADREPGRPVRPRGPRPAIQRVLPGPDQAERAAPPGPARTRDHRRRGRGPRGRGHPPDGRRRHRPGDHHQHALRVVLAAGSTTGCTSTTGSRSATTAPSPGRSGARRGSCSA